MVGCVLMAAIRESSMAYQAVDGSPLPPLVFEPAEGTQPAAGIVMFHGGALRSGSAEGLAPHFRQLAARGILAISAGYRLIDQGAMGMGDCIADVRRAVEHFRSLAAPCGLDSPGRPATRRSAHGTGSNGASATGPTTRSNPNCAPQQNG